jgi:hypothetical protein
MSGGSEAVKFELEALPFKKKTRATRGAKELRAQKRRRRRVQEWLKRYKAEHPCACGERDPVALDLHHVGEFKTRDMSKMKTMSSILKELPYCVVLCANCHRKVHKSDCPPDIQLSFI